MGTSLCNTRLVVCLVFFVKGSTMQTYPIEVSPGIHVELDNENIQYDLTGALIFTFNATYDEDLPVAPDTFLSYIPYFSVDANKLGRHFYNTKTREDELVRYIRYLHAYLDNRVIETHLEAPPAGIRWEDILTKCSLAQVPTALVNRTQFDRAKELLSDTFNTFTMEMAEYPLFYYGEYFNSPLTDCTYFGSTFLLRVLIPIRSMKVPNLSVHRLQSLAFLRNATGQGLQICFNDEFKNEKRVTHGLDPQIDLNHFLVNSIESPYDRSIPNSPYVFYQTRGKSAGLDLYKRMTCSYVIVRNIVAEIPKYCPLACYNVAEYVFPIIQRTSEDTFNVTGNPLEVGGHNSTLEIVCDSIFYHNVTIPKNGALGFKLPCPCDLVVRRPYPLRSDIYKPQRSLRDDGMNGCSETGPVSIVNVVPLQFWS